MRRKGNSAQHKPSSNGGSFLLLPHAVLDSLLPSGRRRELAVLFAIARRFNGFNNGKIAVSMRDIADATGSSDNSANARAVSWLVDAGFLWIGATYPKGKRMAREYGLGWVSSGTERAPVPARNGHLLETEKLRRRKNGTHNPLSVPVSSTEGKLSVPVSNTDAMETCGFAESLPVPVSHTHQVYHLGGEADGVESAKKSPPKLRRADLSSAAMSLDDLRLFTRSYLGWAELGSQSRLAHDVGMPCGTLSKFTNGGASLPKQYRIPLQLAVGRSYPMDVRP